MKIIKTKFKGLLIIKQSNFTDKRGNLRLTFIKKKIKKKFIFDYCTISKKNVVRGFHFQSKFKQSKFVNVAQDWISLLTLTNMKGSSPRVHSRWNLIDRPKTTHQAMRV